MTDLREKLRPEDPDPHEPITSLVCIENTHNYCGGTVLTIEWINQVINIFKQIILILIFEYNLFGKIIDYIIY